MSFKGVPIDAFARSALSMRLGRYVEDRTGLPGYYDIDLNWTPGPEETGPPVSRGPRAGDAGDGPSLFTALEEQLGLKLESARGSVEILVITSADRPTSD